MVRFWLRVLTPRGRRIYLVLASGLFLLSISLLVARSWKLKSPAGNFLYHEELQRTADEIGSSFYYEPRKDTEKVFSHKESKGGLTWFVQVQDTFLLFLSFLYSEMSRFKMGERCLCLEIYMAI